MKLLDKEISIAIIDMDGTLIDSTHIWADIDKEFFKRRGYSSVPKDYTKEIVHMGLEKGAIMTVEKYGVEGDTPESVKKEWRDASIDQYANHIKLKPFAREFLEFLKTNGIIVTMATASEEDMYKPCLKRLGIDKYFELIVDVNCVKQGKSSPAIYDYIVNKFGGKKENTLVVEDSLISLKTAYQAGYFTIGVDDDLSRDSESDKKKYSNKYIYSFKELLENN